ncbi:hypothetical protein A8508_000665 [Escherichia coli]|nr:hypothetical protein [Escherichia coli]
MARLPCLVTFLSCLYGSEQIVSEILSGSIFLSCLYGSERGNINGGPTGLFLSCLYGSELE